MGDAQLGYSLGQIGDLGGVGISTVIRGADHDGLTAGDATAITAGWASGWYGAQAGGAFLGSITKHPIGAAVGTIGGGILGGLGGEAAVDKTLEYLSAGSLGLHFDPVYNPDFELAQDLSLEFPNLTTAEIHGVIVSHMAALDARGLTAPLMRDPWDAMDTGALAKLEALNAYAGSTSGLTATVSQRGLANPKLSDAPPKPDSLGVAYDQGKSFLDKGMVSSGNGGTVTVVDKSAPSGGSKSDAGPKATFKGGDGGKTQGSTSSFGSTQKSKDDGGSFNTGGFGSSDKGQDKGGSSASSSSSSKGDSKGGSGGSSKGGDKGGSSSGKGDSKGGSSKSAKPIVLDLDGDGIEVSLSYSASFDYDGDGFRERTAWAAADGAFLVIDLNADGTRGAGDGQIDQRSELVLSDWGPEGSTDLQALAEATDADGNLLFDTNGDGVLDANDTSYGELRVWQDLDQDGATGSVHLYCKRSPSNRVPQILMLSHRTREFSSFDLICPKSDPKIVTFEGRS
jgi:hypothetical protein